MVQTRSGRGRPLPAYSPENFSESQTAAATEKQNRKRKKGDEEAGKRPKPQTLTSTAMASKRVKRHGGTKEHQGVKAKDVDFLSELPDNIIHKILSLLPTVEVVRTCIISKRWRNYWYGVTSIPVLEFCDSDVGKLNFCTFVDKCLKKQKIGKRSANDSVMSRIKIYMHYCNRFKARVDRWLSFATWHHVKELDLSVKPKCYRTSHYRIPPAVLTSASLIVLKLDRLKLDASYSVNLPSITSLSLKDVQMTGKVLQNLMLGCPSLEYLVIEGCANLSEPKISSLSLKSLKILRASLYSLQVEAVNLESFECENRFYECKLNIDSCKNIRNLSLRSVYPDNEHSLQNMISGLPVLESLELVHCKLIDIKHENLKVFVFKRVYPEHDYGKITVDTPNLVSFSYEDVDSKIRCLMKSPNLSETNIKINYCGMYTTFNMDWYMNMVDFLSYFDCSKYISLYVYSEQALMFPSMLRKFCTSPLPKVKHIEIEMDRELRRKSDLGDVFRWLLPSTEMLYVEAGRRRKWQSNSDCQ